MKFKSITHYLLICCFFFVFFKGFVLNNLEKASSCEAKQANINEFPEIVQVFGHNLKIVKIHRTSLFDVEIVILWAAINPKKLHLLSSIGLLTI